MEKKKYTELYQSDRERRDVNESEKNGTVENVLVEGLSTSSSSSSLRPKLKWF